MTDQLVKDMYEEDEEEEEEKPCQKRLHRSKVTIDDDEEQEDQEDQEDQEEQSDSEESECEEDSVEEEDEPDEEIVKKHRHAVKHHKGNDDKVKHTKKTDNSDDDSDTKSRNVQRVKQSKTQDPAKGKVSNQDKVKKKTAESESESENEKALPVKKKQKGAKSSGAVDDEKQGKRVYLRKEAKHTEPSDDESGCEEEPQTKKRKHEHHHHHKKESDEKEDKRKRKPFIRAKFGEVIDASIVERKSNGKPVNFTSHLSFEIKGVVYKLGKVLQLWSGKLAYHLLITDIIHDAVIKSVVVRAVRLVKLTSETMQGKPILYVTNQYVLLSKENVATSKVLIVDTPDTTESKSTFVLTFQHYAIAIMGATSGHYDILVAKGLLDVQFEKVVFKCDPCDWKNSWMFSKTSPGIMQPEALLRTEDGYAGKGKAKKEATSTPIPATTKDAEKLLPISVDESSGHKLDVVLLDLMKKLDTYIDKVDRLFETNLQAAKISPLSSSSSTIATMVTPNEATAALMDTGVVPP